MPWLFWSTPAPPAGNGTSKDGSQHNSNSNGVTTAPADPAGTTTTPVYPTSNAPPHAWQWWNPTTWSSGRRPISWNDSINATDWSQYAEPRNLVPILLLTTLALGVISFHRSYLRRIPGTAYITPGLFRRKVLLGRVTSVGDGDNFHLFHTPGGRLAGWGWLRKVPGTRAALKGRTIPIRIAGIDAPEGAHFGRPAQPYSAEALAWLQSYLLHRRVHCKIWRRDQYDRVVASVCVRRGPGPRLNLLRRDVGLEMLRRGLATTYEAKTGAEFGGRDMERRYRAAEERARLRGVGLWAGEKASWFGLKPGKGAPETPRQYKTRMREAENGQGEDSAKEVGEKVKNAVKAVAKDVQKGA